MDIIVAIIRAIIEMIEDHAEKRRHAAPVPAAGSLNTADDDAASAAAESLRERLRAQQRQRAAQGQVAAAIAADHSRHLPTVHARPTATAPAVAVHRPSAVATRLTRLLHQPQTLREVLLMKELLDRPVSLRRR